MSRQKELVLQILRGSRGHMPAAQVYERAREAIPNISLGTVYRDLGELFSEGKIGKFILPDGSSVYDRTPYSHGHLICSVCGMIEDIDDPVIMAELDRVAGGSLIRAEIVAEHICPACSSVNEAQANHIIKGD